MVSKQGLLNNNAKALGRDHYVNVSKDFIVVAEPGLSKGKLFVNSYTEGINFTMPEDTFRSFIKYTPINLDMAAKRIAAHHQAPAYPRSQDNGPHTHVNDQLMTVKFPIAQTSRSHLSRFVKCAPMVARNND